MKLCTEGVGREIEDEGCGERIGREDYMGWVGWTDGLTVEACGGEIV